MESLSKIRGLLLDLDGVFYVGDHVIDGAVETIRFLREHEIPCRYVTNTTTRNQHDLHEKLVHLGLPISAEEILSAPQAARLYLRQNGLQSVYLLLRDKVKEDFSEFRQDSDHPQAVVIGDIGNAWSYEVLNQVFQYLTNGARLVALHKNKFWQTEEGLRLDIGAFVSGLEYAAGVDAVVIGKPSPEFFKLVVDDLGLPKHQLAMIGDDIDSDVGGAQACSLTGVLVRTGKYRKDYAESSRIIPDVTLDSIADLPAALRGGEWSSVP